MSHIRKKYKNLSGGMKRRLGIAIALLKDPKVLIVDEPTAGLDPEERVRFRMLLSKFGKKRIVLLSTHIVGDIEDTCQNIALLDKGKIIFAGKKEKLFKDAFGKVKELYISYEKLNEIQKKYYIIKMNSIDDGYRIKIITDEKIGSDVVLTFEDAYITKISKNNKFFNKGNEILC